MKELLGAKLGIKRSRNQTIKAIGDRIEYVDKNIKTVEKKLGQEEGKLEKVLIVSYPGEKMEDGLPLMAIEEELDEDGNVINATVNGKNADDEVRNIDTSALGDFEKFIDDSHKLPETTPTPAEKKEAEPVKSTATKEDVSEAVKERAPPAPAPAQSSDGKNSRITELPDVDSDEEEFMKHETGGFVKVVSDPEIPESQWPDHIPGETSEEAELRKEMLQYNMSEIGHVVAELNLEEDGDYYGYESYSDDEDSEESEEEDEYGRTTKKVVSENYRREMEELQQMLKEREEKLAEKAEKTKNKEKLPLPKPQPEAPMKPATKTTTSDKSAKKGVRFAEELDISPPPAQFPAAPQPPITGTASFTSANLSDIAPADDDALPYLTELMARTGMYNAGPHEPIFASPEAVEAEEWKLKEKTPSVFKKESTTAATAVAEKLTTAPAPANKATPASTVAETVLERAPTTAPVAPSLPQPPKKRSRFRAARAVPEPESDDEDKPPQPLMSSTIVEHPPSKTSALRQKKPSELDPDIHRKEVAERMVQLRGKMAARNGGYTQQIEDEEEELRRNDGVVPIDENGEEIGKESGGKKVSRFKQARLKALR